MKRNSETNRLSRKFTPLTVIMLIVLILYSLTLLGLIFWVLMTALKQNDITGYMGGTSNTYKLPNALHFENFKNVFQMFKLDQIPDVHNGGTRTVYLAEMYLYSLAYCLGSAFFQTLVQCVTAYLCGRFKKKLSKIMETIVIVVMIIPVVGSLPAEIQVSMDLGLYNHIYGMWIMKANFLGMYFLIFLAVFKNLPMTYTEAAKIDGANNWQIMTGIIFPLVRNVFFTIILVNFIAYWKDYQTPLIYLNAYPTVSYGLWSIFLNPPKGGMSRTPYLMAASVLATLPIVILFLIFQKRLLGNLTMGGIKG